MGNKATAMLFAVALFSIAINEARGEVSLRFSGMKCANQTSIADTQNNGLRITSQISVTAVRPNNIFEVEVSGGVPRLTSRGRFACMETLNVFGHATSDTQPTLTRKVALPKEAKTAIGLAWYDAADNVVVSIPAIQFLEAPEFNGSVITSSILAPTNTMLVFKITNNGFELIEIIRSKGRTVSVGESDFGIYQDIIQNDGFSYSAVQGVTYSTK